MRSYGRVTPGTAVPYHHRDPAYVSPARLAELEEQDRRRALLQRPDTTPSNREARAAARAERIAEFARLRESGLSAKEAAAAMDPPISRRTAREYEAGRRAAGGDA